MIALLNSRSRIASMNIEAPIDHSASHWRCKCSIGFPILLCITTVVALCSQRRASPALLHYCSFVFHEVEQCLWYSRLADMESRSIIDRGAFLAWKGQGMFDVSVYPQTWRLESKRGTPGLLPSHALDSNLQTAILALSTASSPPAMRRPGPLPATSSRKTRVDDRCDSGCIYTSRNRF